MPAPGKFRFVDAMVVPWGWLPAPRASRTLFPPSMTTPPDYAMRPMAACDHAAVAAICARVYPTERPYTDEELRAHSAVFPHGQLVAVHVPTGAVAGCHLTLRLDLQQFHVDDPWEVLTAGGSFRDHDPEGHTLYGADLMVHPDHQHHGLGRHLTNAARDLVCDLGLWRMVGGSRLPGYRAHAAAYAPQDYIRAVAAGALTDPVLTAHLHDGWLAATAIQGYLPHDDESLGWAAVIQWLNPACPPPPGFELARLPRLHPGN